MDYFNRDGSHAAGPAGTPSGRPASSTSQMSGADQESNLSQQSFPRPIPALNTPGRIIGPPVRLRRLPSATNTPQILLDNGNRTGRRRSVSAPLRPEQSAPAIPILDRQMTGTAQLATVKEELSAPNTHQSDPHSTLQVPQPDRGRARGNSSPSRNIFRGQRDDSNVSRTLNISQQQQEYDSDVINMLDVVDPEVSTLTSLNNVQNSLFIPYLGRYFSRTPTYNLTRYINQDIPHAGDGKAASQPEIGAIDPELAAAEITEQYEEGQREEIEEVADASGSEAGDIATERLQQSHTLSSVMTGRNYAVLPHGYSLEGWSAEDKAELNDHVRHLLHSRRAAFKRSMKGFGQYVRKPLGFFVTLYAFLLTFWGAAWVLFLIGWIHAGSRQAYFVEICDQILTALFCCVGLGLAPFRIVDTYHMIYIAHYHYLTWQLRKERKMPDLPDHNDLPEPIAEADIESGAGENKEDIVVLTEAQEKKLEYHQAKFMKSHTFYKPHETRTHNAFPIKLLITVVVLLDCHSMFQAALGGTTWGIYYRRRPKALTAVILTCSICCNISGGITIAIGDRRTRKKEVVEKMFRQALTQTAMEDMKKVKGLEPKVPNSEKLDSSDNMKTSVTEKDALSTVENGTDSPLEAGKSAKPKTP